MVSGSKKKIIKNKVNPCANCGQMVMENLMLSEKCYKFVHGRCDKIEESSQTSTQAKRFV